MLLAAAKQGSNPREGGICWFIPRSNAPIIVRRLGHPRFGAAQLAMIGLSP
jgi:hypothetical protein